VGKPCSGCCVRQMGCKACQRCLPKYLCVDVTVTPGPYTNTDCCNPDDYTGDGQFSFRLNNGCDVWSGTGGCQGGPSLGLSVSLSEDCTQTIVASTITDDVFTFDGVLPAGMHGIIENDSGDVFHWEISTAAVVENPLAKDDCSPCVCLQCLPEKLCVIIHANPTETKPKIKMKLTAQWDCLTRSWTPLVSLPDGVSVSIALLDAHVGICGIKVDITANDGSYSGITDLGTGIGHPRRFHGTPCLASDGTLSVEGIPELKPCPEGEDCPDPPVTTFTSDISISVDLKDASFRIVGSVSMKDQSCGECELPCEPSLCCPGVIIPKALHVTSSAPPGCECGEGTINWVLHQDEISGVWSGSQTVCGVTWSIAIECVADVDTFQKWRIRRFCNGNEANSPSGEDPFTRSCDPFHLKFNGVLFRVPDCGCFDEDGSPGGLQLDFTVTA
jgi:hypothetical protein